RQDATWIRAASVVDGQAQKSVGQPHESERRHLPGMLPYYPGKNLESGQPCLPGSVGNPEKTQRTIIFSCNHHFFSSDFDELHLAYLSLQEPVYSPVGYLPQRAFP